MNRPDLRELEAFVAVAGHLSFSKAARQLNLSQPPLTRRIKALEDKVGCVLFERNTHSVSLTDAGQLFLEDAKAILGHIDRASETLRRARRGETARLRLAFVGALLDERLVRLILAFRKKHPGFQLDVTDLAPAAQLSALESGTLEGGFIGAKPARRIGDLAFYVWDFEPLVLVVPEKHPLSRIENVRWRHLKNLPWVMVSRQAAPAFRQQFDGLERTHALSARIVQESDRVPAILTMVAAGSGVSLVPQSVHHLLSIGVVFRKLPNPRPLLYHTFAYRSARISPPLEALLALLRKMK